MSETAAPAVSAAWVLERAVIAAIGIVATSLLASCSPQVPPLSEIFLEQGSGQEEQGTQLVLSEGTLQDVFRAQGELAKQPDNLASTLALAQVYLQAVRESADTTYYDRIEALLARAESQGGSTPDIPYLRGLIALGRHDFASARDVGEALTRSFPQTARYWGLLTDAQVELGLYDAATESLQRMADLSPDYSALTRAAYLREIRGDRAGAREAMEQAIAAGVVIPENLAWALTELARLHATQNLETAQEYADRALETYPDFAPALAMSARLAMARGEHARAAAIANAVLERLPLPEYAILLADIEHVQGRTEKARIYEVIVEAGYDRIAQSGTDVGLERASFLVTHDRTLPEALLLAQETYSKRPTMYAADTLAWALFKNGKYNEAWEYAQKALATGSTDPQILFHALVIAKEAKQMDTARRLLANFRTEHPHPPFQLETGIEEAENDIR